MEGCQQLSWNFSAAMSLNKFAFVLTKAAYLVQNQDFLQTLILFLFFILPHQSHPPLLDMDTATDYSNC